MKGKKTSIEDKAKIVEAKINNISKSAKEIAEEVGISERTASRVIKDDLAKIGDKSSAMAKLIDTNNNLQTIADELLVKKMLDSPEDVRTSELVSLRKSTFEQNRLMQGESTENI